MEQLENLNIKKMLFKRGDSKDIIKAINKECFSNDLNTNNVIKFLNDEIPFCELKTNEKIAIIKGFYSTTRLSKFNYNKLFTYEELKQYEDIKQYEHTNLDVYLNFDFVGQGVETELENDEKLKLLKEYDKFQLNKILMLNEKYDNKRTELTYFIVYQTNLHDIEVQKNKDIMNFTTKEIENAINSIIYTYDTTRQNLLSFIRIYCNWAMEKGLIKKNPCNDLDTKKSKKNSKAFLEDKICGKSDFYNMLEEMEKNTKLPNLIPLLLARYGIIGDNLDKMINLKWEDIDEDTRVVFIKDENGKVICDLPIDDKFIEYIHKAKLYSESPKVSGKNLVRYSDYGYVLKKAYSEKDVEDEEKTVKYATVFNRVNDCCKSIGIKRIPFKRLLLSRQIEILLEIRKYGRLQQKDFEYVVNLFNFGSNDPVTNKAFQLKKRWIDLTDDKVITQRKNTRNLPDEDSEEVYNRLRDKLDLYL